MLKYVTFDIETYASIFLLVGKIEETGRIDVFEISRRKNQRTELLSYLNFLKNSGYHMVGYNNLGFDYPIIHSLLSDPYTWVDHRKAYLMSQEIINKQQYGLTQIWLNDRLIPQIDLMKVHHFDNDARRTPLKSLQVAMRLPDVVDLPYDFHAPDLTDAQMDEVIAYCVHDVEATEAFLKRSKHLIEMREEILKSGALTGDVLNYSEVKIGTEFLIARIGRQKCFAGGKPRQTMRHMIPFKDILLPKINFRTEPYQAVHNWFLSQTVNMTTKKRPHLETKLAGLDFTFGVGGVHASVKSKVYRSNKTHIIKDIDVGGMYVAVAVMNKFAPEHLGQSFVEAYTALKKDRAMYPKSSLMNLLLKLAGNGAYGNSNNPYSPFYDPKYMFTVTTNGQLQLLQLVEVLSAIPGLEIIQANTDGITVYMPRELEQFFDVWCRDWEKQTALTLEGVDYKSMWIRDVNSYIAMTFDGKVKRKGCYFYPEKEKDYDGSGSGSIWNKDFSNLVAQKAAERVMLDGWSVRDAVRLCTNPYDFMLRYKAQGGAKVFIGDKEQSKTTRYYVSTAGEKAYKLAKPKGEIGTFKRRNSISDEFYAKVLAEIPQGAWDARIHTKNKSINTEVRTGIESGRLVRNCNRALDFRWDDLDWSYYENEVEKLIL